MNICIRLYVLHYGGVVLLIAMMVVIWFDIYLQPACNNTCNDNHNHGHTRITTTITMQLKRTTMTLDAYKHILL